MQLAHRLVIKFPDNGEADGVVSAGHFFERKGILDFIALARRMPGVRFFWFGHTDPALVPRAVRKAMQAAPPNLCFAGFVTQAALRDAYCGADAFLFCSHEETEGIVVLEALACGVPVLLVAERFVSAAGVGGEIVYSSRRDVNEFEMRLVRDYRKISVRRRGFFSEQ